MGYTKITFPCGIEIEFKTIFWQFQDIDMDKLYSRGCPLHGKKCHKK